MRAGEVVSVFVPHKLYQHIDVLNWWRLNAHEFPSISIMARVYLSRELSSAYQERIFSNGGYICNELRQSLLDDRSEKLILGKVNCQINCCPHLYLYY